MLRLQRSGPPLPERLSDADVTHLVASQSWYHKFQLRPGIVTPGVSEFPAATAADAIGIPSDLTGKRTLDIGAWDGPLTFELERRGAQAFALDIQHPSRVGFEVARRVLASRAVHYCGSVYQLPSDELRDLDVAAFRGVYYHLKHPILAFERKAASLKVGGTLHFEGEGLLRYAEVLGGESVALDFQKIVESGAPVCLIYPNAYKGSNNWFLPTPAALRACMEAAGLEIVEMNQWTGDDEISQRLYGYARKVREEAELLEHPLY
jgi:tRNA (mo5U34)-methyltransferase